MLGIGGGELIIAAIVLLLVVGPQRMPIMLKAVGRGLREFRRSVRELRAAVGVDALLNDIDEAPYRPPKPDVPATPPEDTVSAQDITADDVASHTMQEGSHERPAVDTLPPLPESAFNSKPPGKDAPQGQLVAFDFQEAATNKLRAAGKKPKATDDAPTLKQKKAKPAPSTESLELDLDLSSVNPVSNNPPKPEVRRAQSGHPSSTESENDGEHKP